MIKSTASFFLFCSFLTIVFLPKPVDAIAVTVKRIVFEGSKRAEVITVINNSDVEETYRLGWKHYKMTRNKALVSVEAGDLPAGVKPAADMVRFSPRRFTLAPRSSQQVRLMLRTPSGLADGEYRSHFYIQTENDPKAFRERLKTQGKQSGAFMRMLPTTSMPVIVRKGSLSSSVEIQNLSYSNRGSFIEANFTLSRKGNQSVYGDLDFLCNPSSGDEYLIKFVRGIAVYSEIGERDLSIKLPAKAGKPSCRSVLLKYTETKGFNGSAVKIYSEKTAPVS